MLLDYALLLSTVLFSCGISRDEHTRDQKSPLLPPDRQEVVDEVWKDVKESIPADFPDWNSDADSAAVFWEKAVKKCRAAFFKIERHPDRKQLINAFVRKFGKDGPQADFAWLLAMGDLGTSFSPNGLYLDDSFRHSQLRQIQLEVAEAQVKYFLSNKEICQRYVHMLYWGRWFDGGAVYKEQKRCLMEYQATDEYWWRSRDLLVMMMSTGFELDNQIEPGKLVDVANRWNRDVTAAPTIRIPDMPFPDWVGASPIPGADLSGFF